MAGLYVDTSALGRVLLAEPDAQAIADETESYEVTWSSALLDVELRRVALREGIEEGVGELIAGVTLVDLDADGLHRAGVIAPSEVRTLDAIHLQAAVELHKAGAIDAVLTFDHQLQAGCIHHGLRLSSISKPR
ncbi:MAG: PIN domain-containing protein [Solirubrobacteraceae bacterium]